MELILLCSLVIIVVHIVVYIMETGSGHIAFRLYFLQGDKRKSEYREQPFRLFVLVAVVKPLNRLFQLYN